LKLTSVSLIVIRKNVYFQSHVINISDEVEFTIENVS